jgi:hydroxymethylbilane synthase
MKIIIGSRGSKLALWQAGWVRERLVTAGFEVEIQVIKTTGDKLANVALTQSGNKGLFIREIEEALAAGEIDLAVHSLKDLPTAQPEGLHVAAVPAREDARDVLVSRHHTRFVELRAGARVGTSSLRRQSQLRALRPDLQIMPVRGNIDTRLRKLQQGEYDALVLAAAGVRRLGLAEAITEYFDCRQMCPAVGQGALALEVRRGDERMDRAIRPLDDAPTHQAVLAERATLQRLGGGCQTPTGAYAAAAEDGSLRLLGMVASVDGTTVIRASAIGRADDPHSLGTRVAGQLLEQGAREVLARDLGIGK